MLAMSEPGSTAILLAVIGVLLAACAVFTRALVEKFNWSMEVEPDFDF